MSFRAYVILAGQSNPRLMEPRSAHWAPGFRWMKCCIDGTYLATAEADWLDSGAPTTLTYLAQQLSYNVQRTAGYPVFVLWNQGEADAIVEAYADAYETNFGTLKSTVESDSGRSDIVWGDTRLHTSIDPVSYPFFATINTAKANLLSGGTTDFLVDPTPLGVLSADDVHYSTALKVAVLDAYVSNMVALL